MKKTICLPAMRTVITLTVGLALTLAMAASNHAVAGGISIQFGGSPYAYYNGYGRGYNGYGSGYGYGTAYSGYGSAYTGYGYGLYGYGSRNVYSYPTINAYGYRTVTPGYLYSTSPYYGGQYNLGYSRNRTSFYNPYNPYGFRRH